MSKPTRLIFLGDVKDTVAKIGIEEWRDIPEFFETLEERVPDIQVVMGNHDGTLEPLLPEPVKIFPSSGVSFGNIGLFHGHAWPAPELLACHSLIMGHVHPTVTFRDPMGLRMTRQVWVKAMCDGKQLAISLLEHLGTKINTNLTTLLRDQFKVKLRVSQLFIMPSFNQFLGGRPINAKRRGNDAKLEPSLVQFYARGASGWMMQRYTFWMEPY